MSAGLRHVDWYLISEHKFRRRAAVVAVEQRFRGAMHLVLCDQITGQHTRLSQRAAAFWNRLDGKHSSQQIWEEFTKTAGPTQAEIFQWVLALVSSGLVMSDHELDPKHFSDRGQRKRDQMLQSKLAGPLSIKLRLFDPQPIIAFVYPYVKWLFTPLGGFSIAATILIASILALMNWQELAQSIDRSMLSQSGLIGLALAYPLLKAIHEFGHGLMVHKFGGEVREFGVMFLIFFPVPYVEASESIGFANKYHRMLVAGAGVIAELTVASLSLFAWLGMEPGPERAILFNLMVIGSVSTVLFNGNPLLKFDSYYVLADWLEIPNLATKSGSFLQDRFISRVLGLRPQVYVEQGEQIILAIYGWLSLAYRWILSLSIILIVSQIFFVVGMILAFWSFVTTFLMPLKKLVTTAWKMSQKQNRGPTVFWRTLVAILVLIGLVGVIKLPFTAEGEGQVVVVPKAELRIETTGVVVQILRRGGEILAKGDPVLLVENPNQTAKLNMLKISKDDLSERLRSGGLSVIDRLAAERELALILSDLSRAEKQELARDVTAPTAGRLEWTDGRPPKEGSALFRGDQVAKVIGPNSAEIVLAFPAAYAGFLPETGATVNLRLPDGSTVIAPITRARVIDQGGQAPAAVLVSGGGRVPEMAGAPGLVLDAALVVWAAPPQDISAKIGMRALGQIALPKATLWAQASFYLRRLFLRANRV